MRAARLSLPASATGRWHLHVAAPGSTLAQRTGSRRRLASADYQQQLQLQQLQLQQQLQKQQQIASFGLVACVPDAFNYVSMILNSKVYDVAKQTDLHHAPILSRKTNSRVLLKREDQQKVHSFKLRGAYNKIVHLTLEEKERGIVACSAGNHAQGVALSAATLGISAKIFMPKMTPMIKVGSVQGLVNEQSEVILTGDNFDEAFAATMACIEAEGRVLVHPFNDPLVIAGQGTIGQEIITQTTSESIDAVFCCVGGGGLVSGIGVYLKSIKPSIKIIGVEAADSAAMTDSLARKQIVQLESVGLFADGAAVKKVGDETFRLCQMVVDEMITVSTDEICAAIKDAFVDTRVVLEPAGALGIAGMKQYAERFASSDLQKTYVVVSSGANMDFDRLRFVSERADTSETILAVRIPESPGSFIKFYQIIAPRNVTEFSYRISGDPALIFMSFQAASEADKQHVIDSLQREGMRPSDLGGNELAKVHGRHLASGRAPAQMTEDEILLRFEFPERPGALLRFLEHLPPGFNVSLFHYRSHGADVGRVLVALQVPGRERAKLREYLDYLSKTGYTWREETENEVYNEFLLEQINPAFAGRAASSRPRRPPPLTLSGSS